MPLSDFLDQLCARSAAAVVAQSGLRNPALISHLRRVLAEPAGTDGSFLADPVLEGAFGWHAAPETMADLASLLGADVIAGLDNPPRLAASRDRELYQFQRTWHPHAHQLAAWRTLLAPDPRSVVVSSGTGSGKTECFLVPMLADLKREADRKGRLSGVRALMLYPLNALIASQRDRLTDWTAPFGDRVRFGLYNGNTPEEAKAAERRAHINEAIDREIIRSDPPPILVTNITMLEYLLIRTADRPIVDASQGKLRWIILDEAHSYIGSQAAELALLLRRVLQAFGVRAEEVRFVATSATIGAGKAVEDDLQRFLSDVAGVPRDRVVVITGQRDTTLPPPDPAGTSVRDAIDALFDHPAALRLRAALAGSPGLTLKDAGSKALGGAGSRKDVLTLAEAAAQAKRGGQRMLPLRLHLVHRAQAGVWVCPNPACSGRAGTELEDPAWPWGAVHVLERERCPACDTPLFELAVCGGCGTPQLLAEEADSRLQRPQAPDQVDEFADGVDLPEDEDEDAPGRPAPAERRMIVFPEAGNGAWTAPFDPGHGTLADMRTEDTVDLRLSDGAHCWSCSDPLTKEGALRRMRFGAPFLMGTILPQMLDQMPKKASTLPGEGRQLITFTDSRQGTARFAARLQQDAERTFTRGALYHAVQQDRLGAADQATLDQIEKTLAGLAGIPSGVNATVDEMRSSNERDRSALLAARARRIPWEEAIDLLSEEEDLRHLRDEVWKYRFDAPSAPKDLARLFLLREFFRRPRRANNAETLGLAALRFRDIEKIEARAVPTEFQNFGGTLGEWKDFLNLAITLIYRANGAIVIPDSEIRWLGMTLRFKILLPPGKIADPEEKYTISWPHVRENTSPRTALLKLLLTGLKLDTARPDHVDAANDILSAAFNALLPLMTEVRGGYRLDLSRSEIMRMEAAFVCPVTRQILDTTFRGLTPWQPDGAGIERELCRPVTLPRLPFTCPRNADTRQKMTDWLDSDERVAGLRRNGLWRDLHDRAARLDPVFLIAEHSAQQPGWRLRWFEQEFRAGRFNILSCSTTMEMGVDIGGLGGVVNTNVPPSPANYRQRVGRAGRRGEAIALALTFARDEPFGWATYANPTEPLTAAIRAPSVSLSSEPIARRHVTALLLSAFIRADGANDLHTLKAGAFFGRTADGETVADNPVFRFGRWCRTVASGDDGIRAALKALVRGTTIETEPVAECLAESARAMARAADAWSQEWQALAESRTALAEKPESRAAKSVALRLRSLCGSFVLGELSSRGVLPAYGFPTDVVSFFVPDYPDKRRTSDAGAGENRFRRLDAPSRSLAQAIRDYAPGSEVVLDGLVYRSAGVTRDWRPAEDGGGAQILRVAWRCRTCDASGDSPVMPSQCPDCGSASLERAEYLRPAGFAFDEQDQRHKAHTDVTRLDYVAPTPPIVSASGVPWQALSHPEAGRMRASREGTILFRTSGALGHGFALCLHCGRAAAEEGKPDNTGAALPLPVDLRAHLPLNADVGSKAKREKAEGPCSGILSLFGIKRNLILGHFTRTDVFELQLGALSGPDDVRSETAAVSLAVALREALARRLGIENREIGYATARRQQETGRRTWSLLLFDQASGGAGFSVQATRMLPELLKDARRILNCPVEDCQKACAACILAGDSRFDVAKLDRRAALAVLDSVDPLLTLPLQWRAFPDAVVETAPLADALAEALGTEPLTLYLGGDRSDWDAVTWAGRTLVERARARGLRVRIVARLEDWQTLGADQRPGFQILARFPEVTLHSLASPLARGAMHVVAAIGDGAEARLWAVGPTTALAAGPDWGLSPQAPLVRGTGTPPALGAVLSADRIAPAVGRDVRRIEIGRDLDGLVEKFGAAFWALLGKAVPELARLQRLGPADSATYRDRYLMSPLPIRLLLEVIRAAPGGMPGRCFVESQSDLGPGDRMPTGFADDWRVPETRRGVLEALFPSPAGSVRLRPRRELAHDRSLELVWANGARLSIGLDQGFGYWRIGRFETFDFTADAAAQAAALKKKAGFRILSPASGPTVILVEMQRVPA